MSVNHSTTTFIQLVLRGQRHPGEIDDFVAAWHASNDPRKLSEALGFSEDEYANWVEQPASLDRIIIAHNFGAPLGKTA
jgi:hypothetical protein